MKFKLIIDPDREEEVAVTARERNDFTARVEELVLGYAGADKLPVYTEDDRLLLPFSRIECVTVIDGRLYAIDDRGERLRVRMRLYEAAQLLPSHFIRINKSTLANETRLERFTASYSGAVDAVFMSGYRDYVSRRCFTEIKRRFGSK